MDALKLHHKMSKMPVSGPIFIRASMKIKRVSHWVLTHKLEREVPNSLVDKSKELLLLEP